MSRFNSGTVGGFGLIELMVSMVLGLLVLGAAIGIFQSNQRSFNANEGVNRVQENARVAFELMSRDIRAAGGSACSSASVVETAGANSSLFKDTPVTGTASEITVTSGDDSAYRVTGSTSQSVTIALPAGMSSAADAFKASDWVLLCNARKTFVIQVDNVSANKVTFSTELPASYVPTSDEFAPPDAVVLARLRSNRWYVDGTTLRVSRLGQAGEAVADGVQGIAVSYLDRDAGIYATAPGADVVAVRVNMQLRGQKTTGGDVAVEGGNFINRNVNNVVSLRGRTL